MRPAAALAVALAAAAWVTPAGATEVTRAELRELAGRAERDPAALRELRRVRSVDGQPVDVGRAIAGARGEALSDRLELLASGPQRRVDPAAARRAAREILDERRFHETKAPRPFRRLLVWLGEQLERIVDPLDRAVPGSRNVLWFLLAAILVAAAAAAALRLARRAAGRAVESAERARSRASDDPARLEREADEAERRGDLERAIRLRFRAGLLRLDRANVIEFRDSLTSGEVARRLRSREFDRVASAFDEIVYGGRRPSEDDVAAVRRGWQAVLEEAR